MAADSQRPHVRRPQGQWHRATRCHARRLAHLLPATSRATRLRCDSHQNRMARSAGTPL